MSTTGDTTKWIQAISSASQQQTTRFERGPVLALRSPSNGADIGPYSKPAGIQFLADGVVAHNRLTKRLDELGLQRYLAVGNIDIITGGRDFSLTNEFARKFVPQGDTTQLCWDLDLNSIGSDNDLEREILLTMLAAPRPLVFPNYDEFASAIRIRRNIVKSARQTQLAFATSEAQRPSDCWTYSADGGFTIRSGCDLVDALKKATQPSINGGKLYSFSCYRATEYVILLAIAQDLETTNPLLLKRLQVQWEIRSIKSGQFHEAFMSEYGSLSDPLPVGYYVPGDRVWFRNPDAASSDVTGYEGSWVFYLGGGLFSNFWKQGQPYTLTEKCVEIYHWRHCTYVDPAGETRIDERQVENYVRKTLVLPREIETVMARMVRLRDPQGVCMDGGCIDASREFPRFVCPGTADLSLPTSDGH